MKENLHRQNKQIVTNDDVDVKENLQKQYLVKRTLRFYDMW